MTQSKLRRNRKIEDVQERIITEVPRMVSNLEKLANEVLLFLTWVHDDITSGKGEVPVAFRSELAMTLDPENVKLTNIMTKLQEVNAIYSDDPIMYAQNLADFKAKYPNALSEMEGRLPAKVIEE